MNVYIMGFARDLKHSIFMIPNFYLLPWQSEIVDNVSMFESFPLESTSPSHEQTRSDQETTTRTLVALCFLSVP